VDFVQIIKSEHARANDILDRLSDTSDGALKTRDRLSGQLATLLDEHARKEETHLYPVLRQHRDAHKDTEAFLAEAPQQHREITRLAGEIAGMAKDDENFLQRVGELKKLTHQHMRDVERLLAATRKAMDDEESTALDDALTGAGETAAGRAEETIGEALQHGGEMIGENMRRAQRQSVEEFERGGRAMLAAAEIFGETAQLTADDLQAIATCSTIAAGGMTELRQAWMECLNRGLRAGARASQEMMRCRSIDQLADVQRSFLKESLENLLEGSAQLLRRWTTGRQSRTTSASFD
jgi:hemerythrin superfamily protein